MPVAKVDPCATGEQMSHPLSSRHTSSPVICFTIINWFARDLSCRYVTSCRSSLTARFYNCRVVASVSPSSYSPSEPQMMATARSGSR